MAANWAVMAASAAGVISAEQAMVLVRERGNAMATASAVTPTGMSAVVGGDEDEVIAAIERHGLTISEQYQISRSLNALTAQPWFAWHSAPEIRWRITRPRPRFSSSGKSGRLRSRFPTTTAKLRQSALSQELPFTSPLGKYTA